MTAPGTRAPSLADDGTVRAREILERAPFERRRARAGERPAVAHDSVAPSLVDLGVRHEEDGALAGVGVCGREREQVVEPELLERPSRERIDAVVAHPRVQFHFTPTSASWLNQVEGLFGILGKQLLEQTDFPSKKALREHGPRARRARRGGALAAYMRSWNRDPTPFAWTKPANAIIKSHRRMLDRISTAVH